MNIETLTKLLAWCTTINLGLLFIWIIIFILAHDWMYGIHKKWFNLTNEQFDAIHYGGMGLFKLFILLFNLVPYLACRIIG